MAFLYAYSMKVYQFKANESEIRPYSLCMKNISKGLTVNMKKTKQIRV